MNLSYLDRLADFVRKGKLRFRVKNTDLGYTQ